MAGIRFILCVHNHQPVGNLGDVFEATYQQAYAPFLAVIERHPTIPWVIHNSGCLWEWLEAQHPEYIEAMQALVARGQVELLAGGFYEPVLPALSAEDRHGQIRRMVTYLHERFGVTARGLWLTERVWEPDLPVDLVDAGIDYLPLDDTQLHQVGVPPERVRGAFLTESGGRLLRIYPALMSLRYQIPFALPEKVLATLRDSFAGGDAGLAVYADDGEKFGSWPGTHKLVYEEGWLERFLRALEDARRDIQVTTFAADAETHAPLGRVYLPTGSYSEMGEWSLPPDHQQLLAGARAALAQSGLQREAELFLRGGFWRNFFARYPESNWIHLRALGASRDAARLAGRVADERWTRAQDHLWRAQCNCGYWHGVFGGLYLPHLRDALFGELIAGEAELAGATHDAPAWVAAREEDLDADGAAELRLENEQLALFLDPDCGGRLLEWDDRATRLNPLNVLSRRREAYHARLAESADNSSGPAEPIHARVQAKEAGLAQLLIYDAYDRAALHDHFYAVRPTAESLQDGSLAESGDFLTGAYALRLREEEEAVCAVLVRSGSLRRAEGAQALRVSKEIRLAAGRRGFTVAYAIRNVSAEPLDAYAGIEWNLSLLAAQRPLRFLLLGEPPALPLELDAVAEDDDVTVVTLADGHRGLRITLRCSRPVRLCRYPIHTVSLSETGAERNYQGTAFVFVRALQLAPGAEETFEFAAEIRPGVPPVPDEGTS